MFNARVKSRIGKNIFSVMRKRIYLKINCRNQTKWNAIQHTWCGCLFTHWIAWPGMYGVCMLEIWVATYVLAGENVLLMGNMDYSATKIFSIFFAFASLCSGCCFSLCWSGIHYLNKISINGVSQRIILVFQWNKSVSKLYYRNGARLHNNHWTLYDTVLTKAIYLLLRLSVSPT